MRPLSVPAVSSMIALISVGLPEATRFVERLLQLLGRRRVHADAAEGLHHHVVARVLHEHRAAPIAPPRGFTSVPL